MFSDICVNVGSVDGSRDVCCLIVIFLCIGVVVDSGV